MTDLGRRTHRSNREQDSNYSKVTCRYICSQHCTNDREIFGYSLVLYERKVTKCEILITSCLHRTSCLPPYASKPTISCSAVIFGRCSKMSRRLLILVHNVSTSATILLCVETSRLRRPCFCRCLFVSSNSSGLISIQRARNRTSNIIRKARFKTSSFCRQ